MTASDLQAGRLVVLVGVALVEPSEFELIRIVMNTADTI
jgi:phage tail sheath protein FI